MAAGHAARHSLGEAADCGGRGGGSADREGNPVATDVSVAGTTRRRGPNHPASVPMMQAADHRLKHSLPVKLHSYENRCLLEGAVVTAGGNQRVSPRHSSSCHHAQG